ncbi:MAG: SDR family NAD(P)-dependent oxidoreductase [Deltaproteobacteria bacterium]|nr:SDR family NAD(P)-dependent oxidoreductase [Deltaproteobacteria bacterium]
MALEGLQLKRCDQSIVPIKIYERIAKWLYKLVWKVSTDSIHRDISFEPGGLWLILSDKKGMGRRVRKALEQYGQLCIEIMLGFKTTEITESLFTVDRQSIGEIADIVRRVAFDKGSVKGIVHLWSLENDVMELEHCDVMYAQRICCESTLQLVKTIGIFNNYPRLWLVTFGAQSVDGEKCIPTSASLWGLGRVISQEHPEYKCVNIDLESSDDTNQVDFLFSELSLGDDETQVAYRKGIRYLARLERGVTSCYVQNKGEDNENEILVSSDATFLIAGGFGGLGRYVSKWLLDKGARHLVLLSRTQVSDDRESQLTALRSKGAAIIARQADISNREQLEVVLRDIEKSMPPLRGVVHAAGVLDDGMLTSKQWSNFEVVMAPKVLGSWNLHELTKNQQLDFFVMFSSSAALLGSNGQGSLSAGSAFMDALAYYRRAQELPALSINWDPWSREGLSRNLGELQNERWSKRSKGFIEPEGGLESLDLCLKTGSTQLAVLPINHSRLTERFSYGQKPSLLAEWNDYRSQSTICKRTSEDFRKLISSASPEERYDRILESTIPPARKILGLERDASIDPRVPLQKLGMDSLMALEIRNTISRITGLELPPTLLLEHPTLSELAHQLLQLLSFPYEGDRTSKEDNNRGKDSTTKQNILIYLSCVKNPRLRLFCFPWAGSNAYVFQSWVSQLPFEIEVISYCLPTRSPKNEKTYNNIKELVDDLENAITPLTSIPYLFYGHSMGAIVAFSLAYQLQKKGISKPKRLIISASPTPDIIRAHSPRPSLRLIPRHIQKEKALLSYYMSLVKTDVDLLKTCRISDEAIVDIPITTFAGTEDQEVSPSLVREWQKRTRSDYESREVSGGHFFVYSSQSEILRYLSDLVIEN